MVNYGDTRHSKTFLPLDLNKQVSPTDSNIEFQMSITAKGGLSREQSLIIKNIEIETF